ncbi:hypothetical protein LUZ60_006029 [Juncus effusus]|nr:hypothetical protein LUZ60_006029 [Juncus effusus]
MSSAIFFALFTLCMFFLQIEANDHYQKPLSNITVAGSVYCDACSNNAFSRHSFFLKGARVQIQCRFKMNATTTEILSLEAERITDNFGIYKLDIPPVDGFNCIEGHSVVSACRASLINSPYPNCNIPGLKGSTQHLAIKSKSKNVCFFNLNAMNYRPAKRDKNVCGGKESKDGKFGSSLFFWPFFPLFWPPWLGNILPPFGNIPSNIPFNIPDWLLQFLRPPFFPFPLVPYPHDQTPSPPYKP